MNEETRVVESDIVKGEYLLERLGFYNEYIMLGTFSIYNNTKGLDFYFFRPVDGQILISYMEARLINDTLHQLNKDRKGYN